MTRGKEKPCCSSSGFNDEDRKQLNEINSTVKGLIEEIRYLKHEVVQNKLEISQLKVENEKLKQMANLSIYKIDELDQYDRRENLRIHGIQENDSDRDDGEEVVMKIVEELNIGITALDIPRAHRLGKRNSNSVAKPRPIIVRFISYKKRYEFMYAKSKLKNSLIYKNAYLTEDLTSLRAKLLKYVKDICKNDFVLYHTINGSIRMKKSAKQAGIALQENEKDQGVGKWLYITSPDDLFKHNIGIDFVKLNYKPLLLNHNCMTGCNPN